MNANMILDLFILIIIGFTVFTAMKNGFVKTAINAVSLILSAILAVFLAPALDGVFNFSGENSHIATYFIVFVIIWIIIRIISIVLDKTISKIPFLRTINKVGGIIIGVILGLFRVYTFCICVDGLIKIGQLLNIEFFSKIIVEETILFEFFSDINLLKILVESLIK